MRFVVLLVLLALALCLVLGGLYLILGRSPRRWRAYRRCQRHLDEGRWSDSLAEAMALQAEPGLPAEWQERLAALAGESHQLAGTQAIKEERYEESLQHYHQAAGFLQLDQEEQKSRVVEAMLAQVRQRLASLGQLDSSAPVLQLLVRVFQISSLCPEATFWQAICLLRDGKLEIALPLFLTAHEQAGKQVLDPAFYVGVVLYRQGRAQEALRYLGEANRVDATCPFVTWQMGLALVAAGGDSSLAIRALQRALGPRGFGLWKEKPERAWVEAFPEGKSYIRRLGSQHTFTCPLLGKDLTLLVRQGQLALAQAYYRQGQVQESADLYASLLQDSPPTVPLLRGYGLVLARLERYDQAYKHLRAALEQENPKNPLTAGYLALCGARGRPTRAEDRPRNITWAARLLARYPLPGNEEWAGLMSAVHAEARSLDITFGRDEQLQLCDVLASVHAADPSAAAAYSQLSRTHPDALRPIHAWLYVRAATLHHCTHDGDLDLFHRTFADPAPAHTYFAERSWRFDDAEYTYLERCAQLEPGRFPLAPGPDYPTHGAEVLLERSRREESAGHSEPARQAVEVLLRLAPTSALAHDRLACLHYRLGDPAQAVALLTSWQLLEPGNHWPIVREAIIEQERGNARRRDEAIDRALYLTRGPLRASVAFLGARLLLRSAADWLAQPPAGQAPPAELPRAQSLLQACLQEQPHHVEALWCLAAVRALLGDQAGLASQAALMDRPTVPDGRFHYMGAVCYLAARSAQRVLELSERAAQDESLRVESYFLMGLAHLGSNNHEAARTALERVARSPESPSADHARALLGKLAFTADRPDDALTWWQQIEPARRDRWGLDEPLRQTVFVSGLRALQEQRFEPAADRFREAGKLGLRHRSLGSLLTLCLVRAGQRLLYGQAVSS